MIDIHSSAVSLLLITSVLISRLTVNLQGGNSEARLCDCQSYNQNSYYVIINYAYSVVTLSPAGLCSATFFSSLTGCVLMRYEKV